MDVYSIYYLHITLLTLCFIGFAIHFISKIRNNKSNITKLPPSPSPTLPIFGNLFCIDNASLHRSLAKLANIHGPIMLLKLGQLPTVVLTSAEVAKEALTKHDLTFSNRTVLDIAHLLNHKDHSIIFLPPTAKWRNLRKLCNTYVFSTRKIDANRTLRENKVQDFLAHVRKSANTKTVVDIGQVGFNVVLNVLSSTLFSVDLSDPSSEFYSMFRKTIRCLIEEMGKPNLADFFPIMRKIDIQGINRRAGKYCRTLLDVYNTIIEERLCKRCSANYVPCNDLLDALLDMKADESAYVETSAISHLLGDLLIAGTDTTSSSFEWAMTELLRNPAKLKTLQSELEEKVGKGNSITESHISKLPYLQAVVKETLRLHPPAPIPVPRKVDADVNIFGYTVPANSMVLINVWAIGRDPKTWKNPEKFEPERFLGSNIDVKGFNFELIPFGAGRRSCPGMPLAIQIMPLMIASLIHEFDLMLEDGITPDSISIEEKFGFTVEKAERLRVIPVCR